MPRQSPLVLDGSEIKLRLQADRLATGSIVHVDWLSFTVNLRNTPTPPVDDLFPMPRNMGHVGDQHWEEKRVALMRLLKTLPDADRSVSVLAHALAMRVCEALGSDFCVGNDHQKGLNYYKFRFPIVRKSTDRECGWVGFLASSDSPCQQSQATTIHVNLTGTACTFADVGWHERMADLVEESKAKITRCDLALDFFDGIPGGMPRVFADHEAGLMDVRGKRPAPDMKGNWTSSGHSRSFYFGSKGAGKQTNVYEKGHQLYGPESANPWQRIELRYGNKLRVLPVDMLRRPDDFFAGASDWHDAMLREHGSVAKTSEPVVCKPRRALEAVRAEVSRNVRWLLNTAAPSVALAFRHLGDEFLELVTGKAAPGRLQAFNDAEIGSAYSQAFASLAPS